MSKPTVAMLMNEVAMLRERVAKLEEHERTRRPVRAFGLADAAKRYLAAHPGAKSVTKDVVEKWLRTSGAQ